MNTSGAITFLFTTPFNLTSLHLPHIYLYQENTPKCTEQPFANCTALFRGKPGPTTREQDVQERDCSVRTCILDSPITECYPQMKPTLEMRPTIRPASSTPVDARPLLPRRFPQRVYTLSSGIVPDKAPHSTPGTLNTHTYTTIIDIYCLNKMTNPGGLFTLTLTRCLHTMTNPSGLFMLILTRCSHTMTNPDGLLTKTIPTYLNRMTNPSDLLELTNVRCPPKTTQTRIPNPSTQLRPPIMIPLAQNQPLLTQQTGTIDSKLRSHIKPAMFQSNAKQTPAILSTMYFPIIKTANSPLTQNPKTPKPQNPWWYILVSFIRFIKNYVINLLVLQVVIQAFNWHFYK